MSQYRMCGHESHTELPCGCGACAVCDLCVCCSVLLEQNVRTSVLHPESTVQVLSGDVLVDRLLGKIQALAEVLGVSHPEAEILLAAHDWDVTAVVTDYVRDKAKARGDVGLPLIPAPPHGKPSAGGGSSCAPWVSLGARL